ncbi:MAG: hypothetical protein QNJ15_12370 [Erythrobacter sp.]|nr:hypothetical protein [Erythrobacter sp.]
MTKAALSWACAMTCAATILAAAANSAPESEFGYWDGGPHQLLVDVLASALEGLVLLPPAMLFVLLVHRFKLTRWLVLTAALATILSVVVSSLVHEFVAPIFHYSGLFLELIGVHRFEYALAPGLLVCFAGSAVFGLWLTRKYPNNGARDVEVFE